MSNFRIGVRLIFETNCIKFSEKLENNFIWEIINEKIMNNLKAKILGISGAHENTAISLNCLSGSINCDLQLYFQYPLIDNNLKSDAIIEYTKLRKVSDNRKSRS